jgi:hypothetical protein
MKICWSPQQVKACRIQSIMEEFISGHLPWCTFTTPYEESDCNCHNPNKEKYLIAYAESIIAGQDTLAELLQEK